MAAVRERRARRLRRRQAGVARGYLGLVAMQVARRLEPQAITAASLAALQRLQRNPISAALAVADQLRPEAAAQPVPLQFLAAVAGQAARGKQTPQFMQPALLAGSQDRPR
jgi:hypothetical protein